MSILGVILAIMLCVRIKHHWRQWRAEDMRLASDPLSDPRTGGIGGASGDPDPRGEAAANARSAGRDSRDRNRQGPHAGRAWSHGCGGPWERHRHGARRSSSRAAATEEETVDRRLRRRRAAIAGFYAHFYTYCCVIGFLAFLNIFTGFYPWFVWPAFGWGIGVFSHYMGVFGQRYIRENYFEPAVEREVRREKHAIVTEKQADIGELSSTIAHEIRNPIAAAKSLVQQMGEDPQSVENVEYARVAIEELDRVERRVSHLLKYAKEEDYELRLVSLAAVVDASLAQLKSKLEAAKVRVARNYIGGPTVNADAEKLQRVFGNIFDNAIDALASVPEDRRIDVFIENGVPRAVSVRVVDNGAGIAPEKVGKIFSPFFTTKDHGTGLGMAIAKKIVDAHQGAIEVDSQLGRGTEFRVTLPVPS
ncbi:MAG TPA: ATP-binding protein [Candidatus Binatia bacterium]|nr:ATP-binding protein [Candidatus Binatia bacterium]